MEQNSFPMREWHVKHMEQTLVKFITGLSEDASRWQMKLNKKYGTIGRVSKRIDYDIKHGVTNMQVSSFLQSIRTDPLSQRLELMRVLWKGWMKYKHISENHPKILKIMISGIVILTKSVNTLASCD